MSTSTTRRDGSRSFRRWKSSASRRIIKKPNVGWLTLPWNDLDAPAGSYDVIVLGQVYHDVILEGGDYEGAERTACSRC